jgi:aryl-alcohol dehydrogenase-like predicted oxidoreductase
MTKQMKKAGQQNSSHAGIWKMPHGSVCARFGMYGNELSPRARSRPVVDALNDFGHPRGLTSAQVALAWLLAQKPWVVPIPGTTKLAHLQENLLSLDLQIAPDEFRDLGNAISKIKIHGDRYTAEEQRRVER